MNENLDLTKILEGCPKGTELYSTVYGKVCFLGIEKTDYPIEIMVFNQKKDSVESKYFAKDGRYSRVYKGECTLFPSKDQQDWAKFERFWNKSKDTEEPIITCDNIPLHWSFGKLTGEKFDVSTLQPYDKVLVRNHPIEIWKPNFFGYINNEFQHRNISCFGFYWKFCIPYNEETQHLVGTKDDCPEYYKWWEE